MLFVMTFFDSTGVGMRYLIPAVPFLMVWVSGLWAQASKIRAMKVVLVVLLVFHAAGALYRFPNYIAYFNEFIGGPDQAYRYVRGNDLEWGQELKNLGRYVQRNKIERIKTQLFGTRDEPFYHIPSVEITERDRKKPSRDLYAISVFNLDQFEWAYEVEPVEKIGHVIWIYDFRDA